MPAPADPDPLCLELSSEAATRRFGRALGECAAAGLVVGLIGNLGAGKTRIVQAAAEGLGAADADIGSPTFVLIREYPGRLPVYHFDTYRLRDADEFLELGADEYLSGDGVCFVEWADRMRDVLPRDRLDIAIDVTGPASRRLTLTAGGPRSQTVLTRLAAVFPETPPAGTSAAPFRSAGWSSGLPEMPDSVRRTSVVRLSDQPAEGGPESRTRPRRS